MRDSRTAFFDRVLQLAALLAVLFVLHAGFARAELAPQVQRLAIEEALIAEVPPSLALAIASERDDAGESVTRARIRHDVAALKIALDQYPGRQDLALARYAERRGIAPGSPFAAALQVRARRFDADAREAARMIAAPDIVPRAKLDDFDAAVGAKLRRAARRLDDFPLAALRS